MERILSSPPMIATGASSRLLGSPSNGTLLLNATPLISLDALKLPLPDLNIETLSARGSPPLEETVESASTASEEKRSNATSAPLPLRAVSATATTLSSEASWASSSIWLIAALSEALYPSTSVSGCSPFLRSVLASCKRDPHSSMVVVTPSPQASSCDSHIETSILAAGCLTRSSETILAPSLVMAVFPSVL